MQTFNIDGILYGTNNKPVIGSVSSQIPDEQLYNFRDNRGQGFVDSVFPDGDSDDPADSDFVPGSEIQGPRKRVRKPKLIRDERLRKSPRIEDERLGSDLNLTPSEDESRPRENNHSRATQFALQQQKPPSILTENQLNRLSLISNSGSTTNPQSICSSCSSRVLRCSYSFDGQTPCTNCQESGIKCVDKQKIHREANAAANIDSIKYHSGLLPTVAIEAETQQTFDGAEHGVRNLSPVMQIEHKKCFQCRDRPFCSLMTASGTTCTKCHSEGVLCTLGPPTSELTVERERHLNKTNSALEQRSSTKPSKSSSTSLGEEGPSIPLKTVADCQTFQKFVNQLNLAEQGEQQKKQAQKEKRAHARRATEGSKKPRKASTPKKRAPKKASKPNTNGKAGKTQFLKSSNCCKGNFKSRNKLAHLKKAENRVEDIFQGVDIIEIESDTDSESARDGLSKTIDLSGTETVRFPTRYAFPIYFDQRRTWKGEVCKFCKTSGETPPEVWKLFGLEPSTATIKRYPGGFVTATNGYNDQAHTIMCNNCTVERFGTIACPAHHMVNIEDTSLEPYKELPAEMLLDGDMLQIRDRLQFCSLCTHPASFECRSTKLHNHPEYKISETDSALKTPPACATEKLDSTLYMVGAPPKKQLPLPQSFRSMDSLLCPIADKPQTSFTSSRKINFGNPFVEDVDEDSLGISENPWSIIRKTHSNADTSIDEDDINNIQFESTNDEFLKRFGSQAIGIESSEVAATADIENSLFMPMDTEYTATADEKSTKSTDLIDTVFTAGKSMFRTLNPTPERTMPNSVTSLPKSMSIISPVSDRIKAKDAWKKLDSKMKSSRDLVIYKASNGMNPAISEHHSVAIAPFDGPSSFENPDSISILSKTEDNTSNGDLFKDSMDLNNDLVSISSVDADDSLFFTTSGAQKSTVHKEQKSFDFPCSLKLCQHCATAFASGKSVNEIIKALCKEEEIGTLSCSVRADSMFLVEDGILVEWLKCRSRNNAQV